MKTAGAGPRIVFNKAAAGVAILCGVSSRDDLHLLDRILRRRAFLALLMARSVSKGGTVEEILCRHGLPAVDARVELASAEHWVAVRLHGQIPRLNLQHRFGETNICRRDGGQVFVVFVINHMTDVWGGNVEGFAGHHLYRFRYRTDGKSNVLTNRLGTGDHNS